MKIVSLIIAIMAGGHIVFSQNKVIITVKAIRDKKGSVMVGLFSDKNSFLKDATYGKIVPIGDKEEIHVVFEDVTPGEYGISIIHDANDNGELDRNSVGIPREGFGFGNNAMGAFGPPSFDKAKIIVGEEPVHQDLRMKYIF